MCYVVIFYKAFFYHLQYYNASESKRIRFSMQENIEIDTKIVQIHQVHAYLLAKPLSADAFGVHLEKWPPYWIFDWHVRQIGKVDPWEPPCQIWCLYHILHKCSIICPTIGEKI